MSTIPFSPKQKPDESTLTDRQRKVLDAIRTHIDEQGFAPSFREIGNAAGLKKSVFGQASATSFGRQGLHPHEREQGSRHRGGGRIRPECRKALPSQRRGNQHQ